MYDSIHLVIKESDLDSPLSFLEEIPCKIDLDKRKCTQYSVPLSLFWEVYLLGIGGIISMG